MQQLPMPQGGKQEHQPRQQRPQPGQPPAKGLPRALTGRAPLVLPATQAPFWNCSAASRA